MPLNKSKSKTAFKQNIMRVALGDPEVADVSVTGPRTVRVKGVNRGKTTLRELNELRNPPVKGASK